MTTSLTFSTLRPDPHPVRPFHAALGVRVLLVLGVPPLEPHLGLAQLGERPLLRPECFPGLPAQRIMVLGDRR